MTDHELILKAIEDIQWHSTTILINTVITVIFSIAVLFIWMRK